MNEQQWADCFSRSADALLHDSGRADIELAPPEYRQALDLACDLALVDFSAESQVQQALRRRLLNRVGTREKWNLRKEIPMNTLFWKRHPALTMLAVALVVVFVVMLAWPGTLTAAAQAVEEFVQSLTLGPNTSVRQVSPEQAAAHPQGPAPAQPEVVRRGDLWVVRTAIGNFGGNVLPGRDASVRRFDTLDETQAASRFELRHLAALPAGYVFREAMVTPLDWVFLFYGGPNGDIILTQIPVGEQPGGDPGQVTSTGVGMLTDRPIESVTFDGQPAGWVEGHGLMWEADGISYTLGGATRTFDEAIRIAESLE
jgi:hypothetical protein